MWISARISIILCGKISQSISGNKRFCIKMMVIITVRDANPLSQSRWPVQSLKLQLILASSRLIIMAYLMHLAGEILKRSRRNSLRPIGKNFLGSWDMVWSFVILYIQSLCSLPSFSITSFKNYNWESS